MEDEHRDEHGDEHGDEDVDEDVDVLYLRLLSFCKYLL